MSILANRYAVHAVVIVLAFIVTGTNIYASGGAEQLPERQASESILGSLTRDADEAIVYEDALNQGVNAPAETSYLAGQAITAQDAMDSSGASSDGSEEGTDDGSYQDDPNELLLSSSPYANSVRVSPQVEGGDGPPTRTRVEEYAVAEGDTVGTIADKFGLRIDTLLASNGLTGRGLIHPGDKLRIPPMDGLVYTVKKGDTIGRIADKYSTTTEKIMEANGLASASALSPGAELILPGGKMPAPPAPPKRLSPIRTVFNGDRTPSTQVATEGRMVWPTAARRITQYYGAWEYFGARHTGIDIGGPSGTAIYAAKDGTVMISGWNRGGYGNMILLDHGGGIYTRYGHASKLLVKAGEQVTRGQVIALMGSTGRSTGPHLHFEVMTRDPLHRVNPLEYIR